MEKATEIMSLSSEVHSKLLALFISNPNKLEELMQQKPSQEVEEALQAFTAFLNS